MINSQSIPHQPAIVTNLQYALKVMRIACPESIESTRDARTSRTTITPTSVAPSGLPTACTPPLNRLLRHDSTPHETSLRSTQAYSPTSSYPPSNHALGHYSTPLEAKRRNSLQPRIVGCHRLLRTRHRHLVRNRRTTKGRPLAIQPTRPRGLLASSCTEIPGC